MYNILGEFYTVKQRSAVYIPPYTPRSRSAFAQVTYVSVNFYCEDKERIFDKTLIENVIDDEILSVLDKAEEEYFQQNFDIVDNLVERLILLIDKKLRQRSENPYITKIKKYVNDNILLPVSIDAIAKELYLSKVYVENIFKKHVGESIVTYVNKNKVRLAKLILRENANYGVKNLADYVGFNDYNYFSRVFKKYTGLSPKQYQKQILTQTEK